MPPAAAREFVLTTAQIPVGADLARVYPQFVVWLLTELVPLNPVVQPVADLFGRQLAGEAVTFAEWHAAAENAYEAYTGAAENAYAARAAAAVAAVTADRSAHAAQAAANGDVDDGGDAVFAAYAAFAAFAAA